MNTRFFRTVSGGLINQEYIAYINLEVQDDKTDVIITTKDNKQFVFNTFYKSNKYQTWGDHKAVDYIEAAKTQLRGFSDVVRDDDYMRSIVWHDSFVNDITNMKGVTPHDNEQLMD